MGVRVGCPPDTDMGRVAFNTCHSVDGTAPPGSKDPVLSDEQWEIAIVGSDVVDADQLMGHPENAKIHPLAQQKSMMSILKRVGWIQAVVVNQRTGRIIDGHMRVAMAISANQKVPVNYIDIDEDMEPFAIATFDAVASQSVLDDDMYVDLIRQIENVDEPLQKLFASMIPEPKKVKDPNEIDDISPTGDLEDLVFGMVGWSEIKVKCSGDEIEAMTSLYNDYRAEQGGNDKGFVAWLTSHANP